MQSFLSYRSLDFLHDFQINNQKRQKDSAIFSQTSTNSISLTNWFSWDRHSIQSFVPPLLIASSRLSSSALTTAPQGNTTTNTMVPYMYLLHGTVHEKSHSYATYPHTKQASRVIKTQINKWMYPHTMLSCMLMPIAADDTTEKASYWNKEYSQYWKPSRQSKAHYAECRYHEDQSLRRTRLGILSAALCFGFP